MEGENSNFLNILSKTINKIKSQGATPGYSTYWHNKYYDNSIPTSHARALTFSKIFSDENQLGIFKKKPWTAAKQILKKDNYFEIENGNALEGDGYLDNFYLNAGKGDDIIDYSQQYNTGKATIRGGQGDDIIDIHANGSDQTYSSLDAFISKAPVAIGGKGSDIFEGEGFIIADYEIGKDVIAVERYNHKKQKPIHKTKVIDGDLYIFNKKSFILEMVVKDITNAQSIDFMTAEGI